MKLTMLMATNTRRTGAQVLAGPAPHGEMFEEFRRMKREGAEMPEGLPVLALLDVNTGIKLAVPVKRRKSAPPGGPGRDGDGEGGAAGDVIRVPRKKRAAGDGQLDAVRPLAA